jgi:hypothetical protein
MSSVSRQAPTLEAQPVELPDVHQLEPRQQVLWALTAAKIESGSDLLSCAEISDALADRCGIAMSRQKVAAIIEGERASGAVLVVRRGSATYFRVMQSGEAEILRNSSKPIFIDPAKALSSIRSVEEVLGSLKGDFRVCDTYVDSRTLDFLARIEKATTIKLLTENIQNSSRLKRDLQAFEKEHSIPVETRISVAGQLHDRYVLHSDGILVVGASLKDIGKKQSMIIALSRSFA